MEDDKTENQAWLYYKLGAHREYGQSCQREQEGGRQEFKRRKGGEGKIRRTSWAWSAKKTGQSRRR